MGLRQRIGAAWAALIAPERRPSLIEDYPVPHKDRVPKGVRMTQSQWDALENYKQRHPPLRRGAARAEFVNRVLLVDGSVSDDIEAVRRAAAKKGPRETGNLEELEAHLAQRRFLFIVNADLIPVIYFQCAVPGNPDVELL